MRRLRRFAVALLGVLLLPLTPIGAGASCAVPVGQPVAGAAHLGTHAATAGAVPQVSAHDHGAQSQHASEPARDHPAPGHEPAAPHHGGDISCPASAACSSVGTAGEAPTLADPHAPAGVGIAPLDVRGPASVVRAPEPPPPRVRRA